MSSDIAVYVCVSYDIVVWCILYDNDSRTNDSFITIVIGQLVLANSSFQKLEDFVESKFYCLHAFADGN